MNDRKLCLIGFSSFFLGHFWNYRFLEDFERGLEVSLEDLLLDLDRRLVDLELLLAFKFDLLFRLLGARRLDGRLEFSEDAPGGIIT
jgi:hypothetical protein